MNLSGRAVQSFATFYKIKPDEILVVCDDMNIPLGSIRFRAQGSAGGQKGLAHIVQVLGTENISRLRLGIGRPPQQMDASAFVLARFTSEEQPAVDQMVNSSLNGVLSWIKFGITKTMNDFNPGDKA
jgi:PTH1 family peptidyl-tRNA hydrolase